MTDTLVQHPYFVIFVSKTDMSELVFIVEESQDGGYFARAVGASIITQADTVEELKIMIKDAVKCHFDENRWGS